MKEARKRNPTIKLYGLPWGFPGWLNDNATDTAPASPDLVFAHMSRTANYTVEWLKGARRVHGLRIDFVGLWNERSPPKQYGQVLADAVRAAGLATTVVGPWPVPPQSRAILHAMGSRHPCAYGHVSKEPPVSHSRSKGA